MAFAIFLHVYVYYLRSDVAWQICWDLRSYLAPGSEQWAEVVHPLSRTTNSNNVNDCITQSCKLTRSPARTRHSVSPASITTLLARSARALIIIVYFNVSARSFSHPHPANMIQSTCVNCDIHMYTCIPNIEVWVPTIYSLSWIWFAKLTMDTNNGDICWQKSVFCKKNLLSISCKLSVLVPSISIF